MDGLKKLAFLSSLLGVLFFVVSSCGSSEEPASNVVSNPVLDSLYSLFDENVIGKKNELHSEDSLVLESLKIKLNRKHIDGYLTELRMSILPLKTTDTDSVYSSTCLTIEDKLTLSYCESSFCTWSTESIRGNEMEVILTNESVIRGFPYIVIQLIEEESARK